MKALEEKILQEGEILPGEILKVGSFLNQQLDSDFLMEMGHEAARLFADAGITKILTIETSGIPFALAVGAALHVPVVFGKKHQSSNLSGLMLTTTVHSYTHNRDYTVIVPKEYVPEDDVVLLVDDFLANGKALEGLIRLVDQAGARLAGCCCAIEKGFQRGGDRLRAEGIRVESLAIVDAMYDDGSVEFREQNN